MKNILIVSQELPYPLKTGGQVSIYARGLGLSKNNCVDLCSVNLENLEFSNNELKKNLDFFNQIHIFSREIPSLFQKGSVFNSIFHFCINLFFQKIPRGVQISQNNGIYEFLKLNHKRYDLILFENYNTFYQYVLCSSFIPENKVALITHNIEKKLAFDNVKLAKNIVLKFILYIEYKKIFAYENMVYGLSPLTYSISIEDFNILNNNIQGNFKYLPQHIRPINYKWKYNGSNKVIFNANLNFAPNLHGLLWYLENVHLKVLALEPNYSLVITGNVNRTKSFDKFPNIQITGFLKSEAFFKEFLNADVMINPVMKGAGVKIKVLDAISIGIPVISTKHSASGIDKSLNVFRYDEPSKFAEVIYKGLKNDLKFKAADIRDYNMICNNKLTDINV